MGRISGVITDKKGTGVNGAMVILKDENFNDIVSTQTNHNGGYELEVQKGYYPFLVAVKDYGVNFLEYWCQDITVAEKEVLINASIDKLEIYGLYCFRIKGAFPALTVYFRPMSLVKYLKREVEVKPIFVCKIASGKLLFMH